jgi:AraC family transcriptional regulator of arabinose operon
MALWAENMDDPPAMLNRVFLREDDPSFDGEARLIGVGCRERMPPGRVERRRGLDAWLVVIFHDPIDAELGGRTVRLPGGSLVLWDRNRPHVFGDPAREWNHSWAVFSGRGFERDFAVLRAHTEQPLQLRCAEHCDGILRQLLREFVDFPRPERGIVACLLQQLLREVGRETAQVDWVPEVEPERKAFEFIRSHLREPLTVERIARAAGLSPSRLQQRFRACYGESLQAGVERQRLEEARYWLAHSGLRIAEVAERAGFADPLYFSRRFRRCFGMSPRESRAQQDPVEPRIERCN